MSERYWISGVQLGCLVAWKHKKTRERLVKEIIEKQFIGIERNLKGKVKTNNGRIKQLCMLIKENQLKGRKLLKEQRKCFEELDRLNRNILKEKTK